MAKHTDFQNWHICLVAVVISICITAVNAGRFLVVDEPKHADVIVVPSGDIADVRFQHALGLLRSGYAQELVLDAPVWTEYGHN